MTETSMNAATPATLNRQPEAFAEYLVTPFPFPGELPISFVPDRAEPLQGSFGVETLDDGNTIVTHADGAELPFAAERFECAGRVPVTVFLPSDGSGTGYLINDPPEPGITSDELDDHGRAYVRSEVA